MKWEGYNEQAAERMNKIVGKFVTSKAFFLMIALASLIMIAGASSKWNP